MLMYILHDDRSYYRKFPTINRKIEGWERSLVAEIEPGLESKLARKPEPIADPESSSNLK